MKEKWYECLDSKKAGIYMDLHSKEKGASPSSKQHKKTKKKEEISKKKNNFHSSNIFSAEQEKLTDEAIESLDVIYYLFLLY